MRVSDITSEQSKHILEEVNVKIQKVYIESKQMKHDVMKVV